MPVFLIVLLFSYQKYEQKQSLTLSIIISMILGFIGFTNQTPQFVWYAGHKGLLFTDQISNTTVIC